MRIVGVFAGFCCCVIATTASAESAGEAISAFGLIGTWSVDCGKDIEHEFGARITYASSPPRPATITTVSNSLLGILTHREEVVSAERVGVEKIKLNISVPGTDQLEKGDRTTDLHVTPGRATVILEKVGSKLRPLERSYPGRETVSWKDGLMPDGSPTKLLERCELGSPAPRTGPTPTRAPPDRAALQLKPGLWEMTTTGGRINRQCLTQQSIEQGLENVEEKSGRLCAQTVTSNTATLRVGHLQCTAPNLSIDYRYEAPSPEILTGTLHFSPGPGNDAIQMITAEIRGKWLGAECNDQMPQNR
jgi:hypothetical protein